MIQIYRLILLLKSRLITSISPDMKGVSCIDFSMNGLLLKMNEKLLTSQQKTSWMSDNVF